MNRTALLLIAGLAAAMALPAMPTTAAAGDSSYDNDRPQHARKDRHHKRGKHHRRHRGKRHHDKPEPTPEPEPETFSATEQRDNSVRVLPGVDTVTYRWNATGNNTPRWTYHGISGLFEDTPETRQAISMWVNGEGDFGDGGAEGEQFVIDQTPSGLFTLRVNGELPWHRRRVLWD